MVERSLAPQIPELDAVALEALRPIGYNDGRPIAVVGEDWITTSDALFPRLQPYPGAVLPSLDGPERFPVPDRPGEWCDRETFEAAPKFMAQWIHWPSRVDAVMEGRYFELPPAHFEGIFTLVCNFMCPHCTRRTTRLKWVDGGTWNNNTPVEEANTLHPTGLRRAIDQLAEIRVDGQMGIVWGGGDPTANPYTYDAMLYARSRGITGSFLTNGVFLEVDRCLDAEPILIRISLNCGTEEAYRRFHGYPKGWNYFERVKLKMREMVQRKLERDSNRHFAHHR